MGPTNRKFNCETVDLETLLKFTSVATGFINSVLKKPLKSKRKVNHRKFLQKQLGAHSHYKSIFINNSEETPNSDKHYYNVNTTDISEPRDKAMKSRKADGSAEKSLEKLFNPDVWEKVPSKEQKRSISSLRYRVLPESFWNEPARNTNSSSLQLHRSHVPSRECAEVDAFDLLGVEFDELLEKLSEDSDVLSTSSGGGLSDSSSLCGKETEPTSPITSDSLRNFSKSVYDQLWSLSTDIVNFTQSDERYF